MSTSTQFNLDDFDFDDSFILEVDKTLLEFAPSSTHQSPPPPATSPPSQIPPPSLHHPFAGAQTVTYNSNETSYSPPRELSQRCATVTRTYTAGFTASDSATFTRSSRSLETDRVKRDECSELRKERAKKEQPKLLISDSKVNTREFGTLSAGLPRNNSSLISESVNASTGNAAVQIKIEQKSIGIQTDQGDVSVSASTSSTTSTCSPLPKLMSIWSTRSSHGFQREFVAKLLETCATDFCELFGCLGLNMTSKMVKECLTPVPLRGRVAAPYSTEVALVSQLYTVLNKLNNDIIHLNTFMEILIGLCKLERDLVVRRSLRILQAATEYLISADRLSTRSLLRDNVQVKTCHSGSDAECVNGFEVGKSGVVSDISGDKRPFLSVVTASGNITVVEHETMFSSFNINWFHMFASLCEITLCVSEEYVKVEAVSILNIILRKMDAYKDRRKCGQKSVYEVISHLLRKEAGIICKREAVHLLYLLLNCPYILAVFCSSCKGAGCDSKSSDEAAEQPTYEVCCAILDGFVDCILCSGYDVKKLDLCRNALVVLAFLASSGKPGLELFLFHKLSKRANFLGLILEVLVSQIDREALESCPSPDISNERTLLIREALVLLNRLVSHPSYSVTVLQVLTGCRDMISLAIDSSTRLSKRSRKQLSSDSFTRQMRESEVVDLASQFKKRIYTFLGESTGS